MYGVEPLKQLPPTEAKPFSFSSDRRLEQRKKQEEGKKEQEKISKQQQQQQAKPGAKVLIILSFSTLMYSRIIH